MGGTNWSSLQTFNAMLQAPNTYAPFWTGIMYMIWIILIVTFLPYGTSIAIIAGSFIAFLLGIFLVYMNLVGWKYLLAMVGMIILMIIWDAIFTKKDS